MKTLEELGISPAPWRINDHASILDRYCEIISGQYGPYNWHNAHLIAASPKLYKALYKITKEQECGQDCIKCTNHGCVIKECKAALAKAAGESEVSK